ncbi:MAG TPA: cytochrome b/b6 domain-containing protein, partial [Spirochaetia bacterium]|nr:cytochrome b/b6 domain-containing protein [Spirochaetia bacterium]
MNKQTSSQPDSPRHNPLTVTLHWLIALIILSEALIGVGILHFWPNTAMKVQPLTIHMVLGIAMLVLMLIQIIVRFTTPRPIPTNGKTPLLDFVAKATHALLYVFTLL